MPRVLFRFTPAAALAALLAALPAALLQGCGGASSHEPGLEWNGSPMPVESRTAVPDSAAMRAAVPILGTMLPKRVLRIAPGEWGDSLRILEFEGELEAYAAFQELASLPEDVAAGVTAQGDRICFRRGRWVAVTDAWTWKGADVFDRALALPDAALPGGIPDLFGSMVHQDRIPGSERILTRTFLGFQTEVPVFSVQVDCHGDTAWVYASPGMRRGRAESFMARLARLPGWQADTVASGLELSQNSPELPPLTLHFSKRGMVGVEACFDKKLTSYWLKMQSRGLKSLK